MSWKYIVALLFVWFTIGHAEPLVHHKNKSLLVSWGKKIRYGAVAFSDDDYRSVSELSGVTKIQEKGYF